MALKVVCKKLGCSAAIPYGTAYCSRHHDTETARLAEAERKRHRFSVKTPEAYERSRLYATAAWSRMRLAVLNEHPLCKHCQDEGRITPASVVDHVIAHRGDVNLFYDRSNLMPLCKRHHDIKTMTVDLDARKLEGG